MQIEKYYKAQELRKEIVEIENALSDMDNNAGSLSSLDKLSIATRQTVMARGTDVIKKELQKIIKSKEKEFQDL